MSRSMSRSNLRRNQAKTQTTEDRAVSARPEGLLLVDKPAGVTSHDVVQVIRRVYGEKSIGHLGTLDPFATGLLIMLIGRSTRLATFIVTEPKVYEARSFGAENDRRLQGTVTRESVLRHSHRLQRDTVTYRQNSPVSADFFREIGGRSTCL